MTTRRRHRTRRPRDTAARPALPLTRAEVHALAGALLRELSPCVGDHDAVRAVLVRWLDDHGVADLGSICMASVFVAFAECMTRTDDVPPGALAYDPDPNPDEGERHAHDR